jgi:hypothetical protein
VTTVAFEEAKRARAERIAWWVVSSPVFLWADALADNHELHDYQGPAGAVYLLQRCRAQGLTVRLRYLPDYAGWVLEEFRGARA